jgi:hypothetical protein
MLQPRTFRRLLMRAAPLFNAPVAALAIAPRLGARLRRSVTLITYTGRRSGRSVSRWHIAAAVTISTSPQTCPTPRRGGATLWAMAPRYRCGSTEPSALGMPWLTETAMGA